MLLFGINFNLYYLLLLRKIKSVFKSTELWIYLGIVTASVIVICANIYHIYGNVAETLRNSAFQVSSVITTSGFSTVDFNLWPDLSKGILLVLMFIGGCAGSTAGGLKVSRFVILLKMIRREIRQMLHPRSVNSIEFEGKNVEKETLSSASVYFIVYIVCFVSIFLLVCHEPFGLESNFTATAACFNNIGPGFGAVGPMSSYADYSGFSKIILSFAMLLGRLEIFPLIIALYPATWSKNK
jgi:trk system potassium uptake protein TrkH